MTDHASSCRPRHASRGQALILAVLVMFLLVGLGGLFIAIISHAMVQTARAEDRDKLEAIAMAGLNMAKRELISSPDGADWRPNDFGPDANNPGWIHFGEGFYRVTVHYGPQDAMTDDPQFLENPLERFLKIDVEARYELKNPPNFDATDPEFSYYRQGYLSPTRRFLTRKLSALVPIGLTDHALWVTNLDNSPEPVVLGSDLVIADDYSDDQNTTLTTLGQSPIDSNGDPEVDSILNDANYWKGISAISYLPVYEGPILVNGNVDVGNLGVFLTHDDALSQADKYQEHFGVRRADQFLVAGMVRNLKDTVTAKASLNRQSLSVVSSLIDAQKSSGTMSYLQTLENNPLIRSVEPPRLDQRDRVTGVDRYRMLTRDSGRFENGQFTGAIGLGEGLYINNADQVQHQGDFAALRKEWLSVDAATPVTGSCWSDDVYDPFSKGKATEVILHDWESDEAGNLTPPYIEMRSKAPVLYDQNGAPVAPLLDSTGNAMYIVRKDYPRNGVLFAEGNLVVKGFLPASIDYDWDQTTQRYLDSSRPGGTVENEKRVQYYVDRYNRRFDLTIVSGGTIYIEGSLLGPATRSQGAITRGSDRDSKLALLAMDNVCLNPTKTVTFNRPPDDSGSSESSTDRFWRVGISTQPLQATVSFAGDPNDTFFLLRDAGDGNAEGAMSGYTAMMMSINGELHSWNSSAGDDQLKYSYFFSTETVKEQVLDRNYSSALDASQWSETLFPAFPFRLTKLKASDFNLNGFGQMNTVEFSVQNSPLDYLISAGDETFQPGFVMSRGDIQVDALVYAQRGSWFVIPGKFYNNGKPNKGEWDDGGQYAVGDRVFVKGANNEQVIYRCIDAHTAAVDDKPNPEDYIPSWPSGVPLPPWTNFWKQDVDLSLPQYREPLDVRIIVNGAIVENRPAPVEDQRQWMSCWRGSNKSYFATAGLQPNLWDPTNDTWDADSWGWSNRRMGIEYHYDATLARPVCYTAETVDGVTSYNYSPRLPKLPVSPTLYSFGAMSGA